MTKIRKCQSPLVAARGQAAASGFKLHAALRCLGQPLFRGKTAFEFAVLLEINREVTNWSCLPLELQAGPQAHVPDFLVFKGDQAFLIDVRDANSGTPSWIADRARAAGYQYSVADPVDPQSFRYRNARDLLRYARWTCPLGDRVRLLAAFDEHGSLTISECLTAFRETNPMAGLASLILHRFVDVDLDEAILGPETRVKRWRD
ncbi:hypothetical protein C7449_101721 [Mycoplana dimorpha]|uniref:TnsA endonuclease-like protein n=1 Tax=Mycoplana dimorpha TaxID=28320 RepID=A0A2T5BJ90_MYCDI|nr:hypothetical protein C7449_101721 [Mycoplana dimorpha]